MVIARPLFLAAYDVVPLDLAAGLGVDLAVLDAVAGLPVDLVEVDFFALGGRRKKRDRARAQRKPEKAFPVGARGHAELLEECRRSTLPSGTRSGTKPL